MAKRILTLGFVVTIWIGLSQAGWIQQHSGTNILYDIDFPQGNIEIGFACGENSFFLKTMDGGEHWEEGRANLSGNFNAICLPTEMTGFIACDSGNIQLTMDGGENWELINVGTENNLNDIYFPADPNFGYVVGMGGVVRKTMDGGRNWEEVPTPTTDDFYAVHFRNPEVGYVVGDNGVILFTSDGGMNWQPQNSNVTTRLLDVFMLNENNSWAVGSANTCLKTTDGGQTWDAVVLPIPAGTHLYSITFPDANTGFICGTLGRIVRTTDGGNTWELNTTLFYHFYRIEFPRDNLYGWVCGLNEAIYYTNDGGGIFEQSSKQKVEKKLLTCSPNPFRNQTVIRITGTQNNCPSDSRIYDANGKLVKTLYTNHKSPATSHCLIWDGRDEANQRVAPGVYFLEYKTNSETQRLKLTVLE